MAWIVTIPKTIPFEDWLNEVKFARENNHLLNYRLPYHIQTYQGEKCYIVHDGQIRGYMKIDKVVRRPSFKCSYSGKEWKAGHYLQRPAIFYPLKKLIPMKGFRGIRIYNDE